MFRFCALLLAAATVACATPMVDPLDLDVVETGFGTYLREGDEALVLMEASDEVQCEIGVSFGAQVALQFEAKSRVVVPIQGVWIEPTVSGGQNQTEGFLPDPFRIARGDYDLSVEALAVLEAPEDLVPGNYTIRFFDPRGDRVYYERVFHVSGCP